MSETQWVPDEGREDVAITKLLKRHDLPLSANTALQCLVYSGVLREITYESTTNPGKFKTFRAFNPEFRRLGYNRPTAHEFRTDPRFYADALPEIVHLIAQALTDAVSEL